MSRDVERPSVRVERELRERLAGAEWAPGAQLPPVGQLAREHATSRATMHAVITHLAAEGLLTVVAGWGTFRA